MQTPVQTSPSCQLVDGKSGSGPATERSPSGGYSGTLIRNTRGPRRGALVICTAARDGEEETTSQWTRRPASELARGEPGPYFWSTIDWAALCNAASWALPITTIIVPPLTNSTASHVDPSGRVEVCRSAGTP